MLTDSEGRLSGIFTDSDLARLLEVHQDQYLDHPVSEVMSVSPTTIATGTMMTDAVNVMVQRKISELPVVDSAARPVGMLDITDVVAWLPRKSDDEAEPATVKMRRSRKLDRPQRLMQPMLAPMRPTRKNGSRRFAPERSAIPGRVTATGRGVREIGRLAIVDRQFAL